MVGPIDHKFRRIVAEDPLVKAPASVDDAGVDTNAGQEQSNQENSDNGDNITAFGSGESTFDRLKNQPSIFDTELDEP